MHSLHQCSLSDQFVGKQYGDALGIVIAIIISIPLIIYGCMLSAAVVVGTLWIVLVWGPMIVGIALGVWISDSGSVWLGVIIIIASIVGG